MADNYAWPAPYKGLSFFTREDVPLFAGRTGDGQQCGRILARQMTRILLLHGPTGCGKSSFLRAGLIPFLEGYGFQFLKSETQSSEAQSKAQAVFVRSTDAPLSRLAEALEEFVGKPYVIKPPDPDLEPININLRKAFQTSPERQSAACDVGRDSNGMMAVLGNLALALPRTLVLIVDQGEELLTLKPGEDGDAARSVFFDFLEKFSRTSVDIKLIIALRTEYYGRFRTQLYRKINDRDTVQEYYLDVLAKQQLEEAIERPTLKKYVEGYGVPYEQYHFSYQPGLACTIANDLLSARLAGGILPFMQIVCDRLYKITKERQDNGADWQITEADYKALGGLEQ